MAQHYEYSRYGHRYYDYWSGYFAHVDMADAVHGSMFDFGERDCSVFTHRASNTDMPDAGYYCHTDTQNVIRDPPTLYYDGGIYLADNVWPIIQLFNFTDGSNVEIVHPGGSYDLTYTTSIGDGFVALDRKFYTQGSNVHITVNDMSLNMDPTSKDSWTFDSSTGDVYYRVFDEFGRPQNGSLPSKLINHNSTEFGHIDALVINVNPDNINNTDDSNLRFVSNGYQNVDHGALSAISQPVTIVETGPNSGIFTNTDGNNMANIITTNDAVRETTATIDYNDSTEFVLIRNSFATVQMTGDGSTWGIGNALTTTIYDEDMNRNSLVSEKLNLYDPADTIPAMRFGSPSTLAGTSAVMWNNKTVTSTVSSFSDILKIKPEQLNEAALDGSTGITGDNLVPVSALTAGIEIRTNHTAPILEAGVHYYLNYDLRSLGNNAVITGLTTAIDGPQGLKRISTESGDIRPDLITGTYKITGITGNVTDANGIASVRLDHEYPIVIDIFRFGQDDTKRYNDAIYRLEAAESAVSSGTFEGTMEYIMLNQINAYQQETYSDIVPIGDALVILINQNYTGINSPKTSYYDLGVDGVEKQLSDRYAAPTHTGTATFDVNHYDVGDTVTVRLHDPDLNTDVDTVDIYTVVNTPRNSLYDVVGDADIGSDSRILDITFDGQPWLSSSEPRTIGNTTAFCNKAPDENDGLGDAGFILRENRYYRNGKYLTSGYFSGSFQVPSEVCLIRGNSVVAEPLGGLEMKVNYVDFRNASGAESVVINDSAVIRPVTGSISIDRTIYPIPWSAYPYQGSSSGLGGKSVNVHVQVNDLDHSSRITNLVSYNISRGSASSQGSIYRLYETGSDTGIFTRSFSIAYNHGPYTDQCPTLNQGCILAGDILTVTYHDGTTASGHPNTTTTSATFALRDAILQTDKSIYNIGDEMVLTLIEPDFDGDSRATEYYSLRAILWNSDAYSGSIYNYHSTFNASPSSLVETGTNTGIFQSVINVPSRLYRTLDRGEEITLTYDDWGPASASSIGVEKQVVRTTVFTSSLPTLELDQRIYTWTDKAYITVTALEHNRNSSLVETIGGNNNTEVENTISLTTGRDTRQLAVSTDKITYSQGETITVTGRVQNRIGSQITLTTTSPSGDLITSKQSPVAEGGTFQTEFATGSTLWRDPGIYTITVVYGSIRATDTIHYAGHGASNPTNQRGTTIVGQTPIEYSIMGGSITNIETNSGQDSLITIIEPTGSGTLIIGIPNNIIVDGSNDIGGNGTDFTILVNGEETDNYTVTTVNQKRSTSIPFTSGSERVEITGVVLVSDTTLDYSLIETGADTGIFVGNVTLTGFAGHDADGDGRTSDATGHTHVTGPADGYLRAYNNDNLHVRLEIDADTITTQIPIRWNIGAIAWPESSYQATDTGIVRVNDTDMNLNPEAADSFEINVLSDSDPTGIDLTVTETGKATGIFEGAVDFVAGSSSGRQLQVSNGDIVTAIYNDHTMPSPYSRSHHVTLTATALIGNIITLNPIDNMSMYVHDTLDLNVAADDVVGYRLTFNLTGAPPGAEINSVTGRLRWTPTADQAGNYTFTIAVTDGRGNSDSQNITIMVRDLPNLVTRLVVERYSVSFTITSDTDGTYDWSVKTRDTNATQSTGVFTSSAANRMFDRTVYNLDPGTDYSLQIMPSSGEMVQVDFRTDPPPGRPPVARDYNTTITEDDYSVTAVHIRNLRHLEPDGDSIVFTNITQPSHGRVQYGCSGACIIYYPTPNYHGPDSFTYAISDRQHPPVTGTVNITVTPVNDLPVIQSIPVQRVDIGRTVELQVRASDTDDPDQIFHYVLQSTDGSPLPAGLRINSKGLITWTPTESQKGTYTIQLQVSDDDSTSTQNIVFRIGRPDSIIEPIGTIGVNVGERLNFRVNTTTSYTPTFSIVDRPAGAYLSYSGSFSWTPGASQKGPHTFAITALDRNRVLHTEKVTIVVYTVLRDDILTFAEIHDRIAFAGQPFSFTAFPISIPEGRAALFSLTEAPDGASIGRYNGTLTWTPDSSQTGQHTFVIEATAGTYSYSESVTVTVSQLPVPVTRLVTGPDSAAFTITSDNDESYSWSIIEKDSQIVKFVGSFALSDANRLVEQTVSNIEPNTVHTLQLVSGSDETIQVDFKTDPLPGSPPVVRDDNVTVREDSGRNTIRVIDDDADPDGDSIRVIHHTQPSHGDVQRASRYTSSASYNRFYYTPDSNYHGQDSFTYTISDGVRSTTGSVNITITPVNDLPYFHDSIIVNDYGVDQLIVIPIPVSDIDDPVESLTYTLRAIPSIPAGAAINASGVFTWTPTEDQAGSHSIDVIISDGAGAMLTYTLNIDITENYIELDKSVYSWTDRMHIRIVAPDLNRNDTLVETIGNTSNSRVKIANNYRQLDYYSLVETGINTGVFAGTVLLTGHSSYDADGDGLTGDTTGYTGGTGPDDGRIRAANNNDLVVTFQTSEYRLMTTVPISWNTGQVGWSNAAYLENGTAKIKVIDPDRNLNPDAPDSLDIDVPSDSDRTGIDLTLTETANATGVFEGVVYFVTNSSSGNQLMASEGDIITAEYSDHTLPYPASSRSRHIEINATAAIGNVITLDPIGDRTVRAKSPMSFQAMASDIAGDQLTFDLADSPPAGAAINGITGVFEWIPTASQTGRHMFAVMVYDQQGRSAHEDITVTVHQPNRNPIAPDIKLVTNQGSSMALRPNIDDPDGDETTITSMSTPGKGRIMPARQGINDIIYRANPNEHGTDYIRYTVSDSHGGTATGTITITIEQISNEPSLDFIRNMSVTVYDTLRFQAGAADRDHDPLTYTLSGHPRGANITQTGAFSWTPDDSQIGPHTFTVTVSDDDGSDSQNVTITVNASGTVDPNPVMADVPPPPSRITPVVTDPDDHSIVMAPVTDTATGSMLEAYMSRGLVVFAGSPAHSLDATRGNTSAGFLLAGIIINGAYAGLPGAGIAHYDGIGPGDITVFISEIGNAPPVLSPVGDHTINALDTLTFTVSATDFNDTVSYRLSGAPGNAAISEEGIFRWMPGSADEGSHAFMIIAYDRHGTTDSESVTIAVLPAGTPNESPTAPDVAATVSPDGRVVIIPAISDPDGDPTRITGATGNVEGTIISSDNGIEYIAGPVTGTETVTYTVADGRGGIATGTITITIQ